MKKVVMLTAVAVFLCSVQSFAQSFKFGHINMSELILLMPERDSAVVKLEKYAKDLDETMQSMQEEMQKKYQDYRQNAADWLPAIVEAKEKELTEMQQRLQQFSQNASMEYSSMQQQLLEPVVQKAREAVEKIGKANGYTYIFDLSANSIIYFNAANSTDLLPLAKSELGIPADKTVPTNTAAAAN